jgi:phenylalanyl-tRNA synthetase beta chain
MKFSQQWLQEWFKIDLTTESLVKQLTMAGLEVDRTEPVAGAFTKVIVGEVLEAAPHTNADKLQVCTVNVGKSNQLNIVCGAKNVHTKMKVAVAQVGATLPGNFKIKKAKIRGVESCGMLCSTKELGLAETSAGIMELPPDAPIGADVATYLQLDDVAIDIDLTPNRGDCASLVGVAREVAAINECPYYAPKIKAIKPTIKDILSVKLTGTKACPQYVGRVIRDVNLQATTPLWMQERLRRSGMRSIDPVVDVTNYVLLELGQPMHAFDLANISEGIEIRMARKNEQLTLLDETNITLTRNDLVIADHKQAIALAGVMGGITSGVSAKTKDIFLESAYFDPIKVAETARHYGLQTDSSYRFERGVDFQLQTKAMERATELLLDIVGGKAGPIIKKQSREFLPRPKKITLRLPRVAKILGIKIPSKTIKNILQRLEMPCKKRGKNYQVNVPSHRFDCAIEVDLIEEIARIYGYENIPAHTYAADLIIPPIPVTKTPTQRICDLLQDRDYNEVITYSFVDPQLQKLLDPNHTPLILTNPIANNMSVMRTNLWPGLLDILVYNLHRQQERVRLFETGLRFRQTDGKLEQQSVVSGIAYGAAYHKQWGETERHTDFFDIKADVESLLAFADQSGNFSFRAHQHPALHPGKCAQIFRHDNFIGYLGALHPGIMQQLGLKQEAFLFELSLDAIQEKSIPKYKPISKYPAICRDLAFLAKKDISAEQIKTTISKQIGKLLIDLTIFDVYQGKDMHVDQKSIALSLTFQDSSRTLNDNEVNELLTKVITSLEEKLGLKLRK